MTLGYAWFDSYDSVGYVLTLHIFPPYNMIWRWCHTVNAIDGGWWLPPVHAGVLSF